MKDTLALNFARALAALLDSAQGADPAYTVMPSKRVRVALASACTGYTVTAIRRKLEQGVWIERVHWFRAPDGCIFIDLEAVDRWIMSGGAKPRVARRSGPSRS